jgi:2,3-diketo-5-methylthiopentyl-1-phosphate enolase
MARFLRAAGADFSLFPSPYGKLGLPREVAADVSEACRTKEGWPINEIIPVPSAGIRPEHAPLARADFGVDFVLNAGTAIFATKDGVGSAVATFRKELYGK